MTFSTRVQSLLSRSVRDKSGGPNREAEILQLIADQGGPLNHPIVNFQLEYGGYKLILRQGYLDIWLKGKKVPQYGLRELQLGLSWDASIVKDEDDGRRYVTIGHYKREQDGYTMTQDGYIQYAGLPYAETSKIMLERVALLDAIWDESPYWYLTSTDILIGQWEKAQNLAGFLEVELLPEVSDSYTSWWKSSEFYICVSNDSVENPWFMIYTTNLKLLKPIEAKISGIVIDQLESGQVWYYK